jgi:hypothetical protein
MSKRKFEDGDKPEASNKRKRRNEDKSSDKTRQTKTTTRHKLRCGNWKRPLFLTISNTYGDCRQPLREHYIKSVTHLESAETNARRMRIPDDWYFQKEILLVMYNQVEVVQKMNKNILSIIAEYAAIEGTEMYIFVHSRRLPGPHRALDKAASILTSRRPHEWAAYANSTEITRNLIDYAGTLHLRCKCFDDCGYVHCDHIVYMHRFIVPVC